MSIDVKEDSNIVFFKTDMISWKNIGMHVMSLINTCWTWSLCLHSSLPLTWGSCKYVLNCQSSKFRETERLGTLFPSITNAELEDVTEAVNDVQNNSKQCFFKVDHVLLKNKECVMHCNQHLLNLKMPGKTFNDVKTDSNRVFFKVDPVLWRTRNEWVCFNT